MLVTSTTLTLFTAISLFFILSSFHLFVKQNKFIFTKIWIVFIFFITLNLLLAYFGEDFFVIFALAAELPVFFGFFFFFVLKTQLHQNNNNAKQGIKRTQLVLLTLILFWIPSVAAHPTTFFNMYDSFTLPSRSDFYILYFSYYVTAPMFVVWVGFLITVVTLILIVLTFLIQIKQIDFSVRKKKNSWVKTQNINKQTTHQNSILFFKY